jgi:iron complex transport system substrate-binding protein
MRIKKLTVLSLILTVTPLILTLIPLIILAACNGKSSEKIIDRAGREISIKSNIKRIVSTAPSNTEIITDLGMAQKLVAIDRHSANVTGIPGGLPLLDFFRPDAELIIRLEPDIIIASGHNPTGTGEDPFQLLSEMGIAVVYIPMSKNIDGIYMDIAFIAGLLQVEENGKGLIESMKNKIAEIRNNIPPVEPQRTVYFEISAAPEMMSFGKNSFIHDMIETIKATNIFGNENWLVSPGAESIIERNPDVILTNVSYIDDPIAEIINRPGFNHINAVKNNRVYKIDTDSSVRPSARIILALWQMASAVYSEEMRNEE